MQIKLSSFRLFRLIPSSLKKLRPRKIWDFQKKIERGDGRLELGLLKLPTFGKKANGRVSGAPETCFFMFFGLNAAPSKTSNLSTFFKLSSSDIGWHTFDSNRKIECIIASSCLLLVKKFDSALKINQYLWLVNYES